MAIANDGTPVFNDALTPTTTITATKTMTAGARILICVSCDKGGGATSTTITSTGSGETFTKLLSITGTDDNELMEVHISTNAAGAAGGSTTYTCTFNAGADGRGIVVHGVTGADTTALSSGDGHSAINYQGPATTGNPSVGANTCVSGNANPQNSGNSLAIGFGFNDHWAAGAPSAGTSPVSFTSQGTGWSFNAGHVTLRVETAAVSGAGPFQATFGATGSEPHITAIVVLSEPATAASDIVLFTATARIARNTLLRL